MVPKNVLSPMLANHVRFQLLCCPEISYFPNSRVNGYGGWYGTVSFTDTTLTNVFRTGYCKYRTVQIVLL